MTAHPLLAVVASLALIATACAGGGTVETAAGAADDEVHVVVTTTIMDDLVRQVAGDDARVDVLMASGQDPHGYAPSAQQAAMLRDADLVVANGLGLEEGLLDALEAAEADGATVLRIAEEVAPIQADEDAPAEDADGHQHSEGDPHVWFDPLRMAAGARLVADALATVDADTDWEARAADAAAALEDLDEELAETLSTIPERCRRLVTTHESFGYLAERYDLEVIATVVPGTSTEVGPSAQAFAALIDLVRESGVPAIFAENTQSSRLADALATEVGRDVAVVPLYTGTLGEPGSAADTYAGMMRTDAERIAVALEDC